MNARLEELLLRLVNTSGPVRALSASECHELLGLVEALDELVMKPKWCPDRCPITFRPFFMWLEHPEKGLVPTYGGPYDSYTIPEPEMPEDGKKTEFHDIEFYCERYDHDEGAWVDGSEDPGHRVIIQDRLVELDEFNDLKARVKELEGLPVSATEHHSGGAKITVCVSRNRLKLCQSTLGDAMPRKEQP